MKHQTKIGQIICFWARQIRCLRYITIFSQIINRSKFLESIFLWTNLDFILIFGTNIRCGLWLWTVPCTETKRIWLLLLLVKLWTTLGPKSKRIRLLLLLIKPWTTLGPESRRIRFLLLLSRVYKSTAIPILTAGKGQRNCLISHTY